MNDEQKALARGKYEFKKEELNQLKTTLRSQANEISETLRQASESPTAAYIESKREMIEDALNPISVPSETHLDQLPNKIQNFIENIKKYQEANKEAVSLGRQAR